MATPTSAISVTNTSFLEAAFFPAPWRQALVAGFPGDPEKPDDANWQAYRASCLPGLVRERNLNMYFCPSLTFTTRRQLSEFVSFHVIVIDDYGTKVVPGQPEKLLGRPANYIIETSPGNYQAGWFLEPVTDLAWVKGMLRKLKDRLGAGDNLTDPMAWRRLPIGINGKTKYRTAKGLPWVVDIASKVYP
jgi:hypothetical protein